MKLFLLMMLASFVAVFLNHCGPVAELSNSASIITSKIHSGYYEYGQLVEREEGVMFKPGEEDITVVTKKGGRP